MYCERHEFYLDEGLLTLPSPPHS